MHIPLNVTWDGRCGACGTKVATAGCPNSSCSENFAGPRSRIKVIVGHGGSIHHEMQRTLVEFPFTEANPSMAAPASTVYDLCRGVLEGLTPHQRDVVLANLIARYGERV